MRAACAIGMRCHVAAGPRLCRAECDVRRFRPLPGGRGGRNGRVAGPPETAAVCRSQFGRQGERGALEARWLRGRRALYQRGRRAPGTSPGAPVGRRSAGVIDSIRRNDNSHARGFVQIERIDTPGAYVEQQLREVLGCGAQALGLGRHAFIGVNQKGFARAHDQGDRARPGHEKLIHRGTGAPEAHGESLRRSCEILRARRRTRSRRIRQNTTRARVHCATVEFRSRRACAGQAPARQAWRPGRGARLKHRGLARRWATLRAYLPKWSGRWESNPRHQLGKLR